MTVSQATPPTPAPASRASQGGDATWVSHWHPGGDKVSIDCPARCHSPTHWSYARLRGILTVVPRAKVSVLVMEKLMEV